MRAHGTILYYTVPVVEELKKKKFFPQDCELQRNFSATTICSVQKICTFGMSQGLMYHKRYGSVMAADH